MANAQDKNSIEEQEKGFEREEGKVPTDQDGTPTPNGQDEPSNPDIAKQTV